MNTVLSNSASEIVLPATVTGTFKKPRFAPDVNAIAQLQKQKFLPTLSNPGALNNILGVFGGKKEETPTDKPAEQKRDPVKSILDLFGRKKAADPAK
jgi:hypothetical protein